MSVESITAFIEPVRKRVMVPLTPIDAFALFTADVARWWPLATHSVGQARSKGCAIEPRVGGTWLETLADGTHSVWGTVLVWEPPHRVVVTWHPGRQPDSAQEIEIRFTAAGTGTRVDLEHRNWQSLGAGAAAMRDRYDQGWNGVLTLYLAAAD
jgi:uncharacterized protein YndB with AHSA1/START domain